MTHGQYPDEGQPTTRFGDPYRAEQQPYGQPPYGQQQPLRATAVRAAGPASGRALFRGRERLRGPVGSGAQFGVVGVTLAGIGFILLIISLTAVTGSSCRIVDRLQLQRRRQHPRLEPGRVRARERLLLLAGLDACHRRPARRGRCRTCPHRRPARCAPSVRSSRPRRSRSASSRSGCRTARRTATRSRTRNVGFYLAVGGFLLVGIGALVGPKRA